MNQYQVNVLIAVGENTQLMLGDLKYYDKELKELESAGFIARDESDVFSLTERGTIHYAYLVKQDEQIDE